MSELKLKEIKIITGKICLLTGLHIGSGQTEMQIGGTDNMVIKHPYTNEPYIPGSSLKGKIRSLLELYYGIPTYAFQTDNKSGGLANPKMLNNNNIPEEIKEKGKIILKLFGLSGSANERILEQIGPSRLAFSDCFLSKDYVQKVVSTNLPFVEVKAENRINRITGTAEHPRFPERVPAGAEFDFRITFKVLRNDDEALFNELLKGMKLLEYDYLGGSGSRGYGRIKFEIDNSEIREQFEAIESQLF